MQFIKNSAKEHTEKAKKDLKVKMKRVTQCQAKVLSVAQIGSKRERSPYVLDC